MKSNARTWGQFATTFIIAVAVAMLWIGAGGFCVGVLENRHRHDMGSISESLEVMRDGTPLIESRAYSDYMSGSTFRRLDGQVVSAKRKDLMSNSIRFTPGGTKLPSFVRENWYARVAGISDSQDEPVSWYALRPDDPLGPAYLVGYDELSRRRVGFIGTGGFRLGLPPRAEWFQLPRRSMLFNGVIAAVEDLSYGSRPHKVSSNYESKQLDGDGPLPWQVFVLDGNRLLEVDVRTRSVRTVYEMQGLESVEVTNVPLPPTAGDNVQTPLTTDAKIANEDAVSDGQIVSTNVGATASEPVHHRVAAKAADRIAILNSKTGDKREFILPVELRDFYLSVYLLPGDKLLVVKREQNAEGGVTVEMFWLTADGNVIRKESVRLAGVPEFPIRQVAWALALVVPLPVFWLGVIALLFPHSTEISPLAYSDALAYVVGQCWPAAIVVAAVGALLVWITYCQQFKYRRPSTIAWCAFVLLFGVPGLIAYWIEIRRPKLEACRECKAAVPRDREVCANCNALFRAPSRVGTEIYA